MSLNNIANVLLDEGDLAGAESSFRQCLAMRRELLGGEHPLVAQTLNNLAYVYYDRGNVRAALDAARESLDVYRRNFPGDNRDVASVMNVLGYWLTEAGDYAEANRHLTDALAMRTRLFGTSHPDIAASLVHVGILQVATHHYPEALLSARRAGEIFTAALSATSWKTALAQSVGGAALAGLGEYQAAEKQLQQSYAILRDDAGAMPMYRALARRYVEDLNRRQGRMQQGRHYAAARNRAPGAVAASLPTPLVPTAK